jgi:hypothetical protein
MHGISYATCNKNLNTDPGDDFRNASAFEQAVCCFSTPRSEEGVS